MCSVGECFDKIARLVGITAIPGGPLLERLADEGEAILAHTAAEASAAAEAAGAGAAAIATAGTKAAAKLIAKYEVTMPMQSGAHRESCNFSFSGIKTSVAKLIETERERLGLPAQLYTGPGASSTTGSKVVPPQEASAVPAAEVDANVTLELHRATCLIAAGFQRVSVRFLQQRARRALQWLAEDAAQQASPPVTCLVVAGGVAANRTVRAGLEAVAAEAGVLCVCPPVQHCTDNGLMVAWTGIERLRLGLFRAPPPDSEAAVAANVDVLPRWPIGPVDPRSAASGMKHIKAFK